SRRRYGGYIIHVGIVSIFVGIAASSVFRVEAQQTMKAGDEMRVGRYTLRYDRIESQENGHVARTAAVLPVFVDGRQIDTLMPEKRFYKKPKQPTTEVANRSTLREDLYVVLGSYDPQTQLVTIQAYVNPLVVWIWLGGLILALGTAVAVWPTAAERRAGRGSPSSERAPGNGSAAAGVAGGGGARHRRPDPAGDRGGSHLPVRLRPHGALLQPPQLRVRRAHEEGDRGAARARRDPRSDPDRVHRPVRREGPVVAHV